jgi:hypothetical protein
MIKEASILIVEEEKSACLPALASSESIHYQSGELLPKLGSMGGMIIRKRERRIDDAHSGKALFNTVYDEVVHRLEAVDGVLSGEPIPEAEKREVREVAFPGEVAAEEIRIRRILEYLIERSGHKPRERRKGVSILVFVPPAGIKVLTVRPGRA